MKNPKVSVLLLTWNRKIELNRALLSVSQQSMTDIELVVVDSGSTDGTRELLAEHYPQAKYIRLPYNMGVIGGRNLGIANCSGDLIFLLDDDAVFLDDRAIERVYREFERDPRLAIIFCKILNAEGEITPWTFRGPVEQYGDTELISYTFIGAAHCIRRNLFEEVGYMDASYFRNGEETEFSLKVYGAGYYVLYYPHVEVLHRESQTTRNPSGKTEFYKFRNDILTYWKHLPLVDAAVFTLTNIALDFLRSIKRGFLHWYLYGLLHLMYHIPVTLMRKRQPIPKDQLALWYKAWSEIVERDKLDTPQARTGTLSGYMRSYFRRNKPNQPLHAKG